MNLVFFLVFFTVYHYNTMALNGLFGGKSTEILEIVGISGATCNMDAECSHGHCNTKTKTCSCDLGWTGATCNEMVNYNEVGPDSKDVNSKTNPDHAYLIDVFKTIGNRQRNRNHPIDLSAGVRFKTAPNIQVKLVKDRLKESPKSVAGPAATQMPGSVRLQTADLEALVVEMEENDACSDRYKYKPLDQRTCSTGLECEFGTCSSINYGSYIAFECKCDRGAQGLLCEKKCCKNCGKNGRCDFYPDGTPFCFCKRGFYGNKCEFSFSKMLQKDHLPIHATSSSLQQHL